MHAEAEPPVRQCRGLWEGVRVRRGHGAGSITPRQPARGLHLPSSRPPWPLAELALLCPPPPGISPPLPSPAMLRPCSQRAPARSGSGAALRPASAPWVPLGHTWEGTLKPQASLPPEPPWILVALFSSDLLLRYLLHTVTFRRAGSQCSWEAQYLGCS